MFYTDWSFDTFILTVQFYYIYWLEFRYIYTDCPVLTHILTSFIHLYRLSSFDTHTNWSFDTFILTVQFWYIYWLWSFIHLYRMSSFHTYTDCGVVFFFFFSTFMLLPHAVHKSNWMVKTIDLSGGWDDALGIHANIDL